MEECYGGEDSVESTGYGSLTRIVMNKIAGGKRNTPQEKATVVKPKIIQNQTKLLRCPQCDFISQNETYFIEHITKVHVNQPTCPFCFKAFKSYTEVRKHCEHTHIETRNSEEPRVKRSRTKPCRYFRNGSGTCSPPSGVCNFDHSVIPDNEREFAIIKKLVSTNLSVYFFIPRAKLNKNGNP